MRQWHALWECILQVAQHELMQGAPVLGVLLHQILVNTVMLDMSVPLARLISSEELQLLKAALVLLPHPVV